MSSRYPTDADIRNALLARASLYAEQSGTALSAVGKRSLNDPAFFARLAAGRNFTISTYQRAMEWLDQELASLGSSLRTTRASVNDPFGCATLSSS